MGHEDTAISDDILRGAKAIAEWLWGDASLDRRVYHLFEKGTLPAFRLGGSVLHARKSTLLRYIADQENRTKPGAVKDPTDAKPGGKLLPFQPKSKRNDRNER